MARSDRKGARTYTKVLISVTAVDRPSQYIMHASTGVLWCGPRMHTAGRQERRRPEDMEWDGVRRTHPKERPAVRRTVVHLATAPSRTPGRG
jgi:hypothetical protein